VCPLLVGFNQLAKAGGLCTSHLGDALAILEEDEGRQRTDLLGCKQKSVENAAFVMRTSDLSACALFLENMIS